MTIRPGELYLAHVGGKLRPVVVVSREELNRGTYVTVVPFTTQRLEERRNSRTCVAFRAGDCGLNKDCVAQAEAIAQFEIALLDDEAGPLGNLDEGAMREL